MNKTVYEYNRTKALFRLKHHPDCRGVTVKDGEDGNSLVFTALNGTRVRVGDSVEWLRGDDGEILDQKLSGAMGLMSCLLDMYRTVDTEKELEDLVCELYCTRNLREMGTVQELLEKAFMFMGLDMDEKIGFRGLARGLAQKMPGYLRGKCGAQLRSMLERETWDWGSLTWIPLKELVKLVSPNGFIEAVWQAGSVACAEGVLYHHYQDNGKLDNRYAKELQRRVRALDEEGKWPKVA